MKYDRNGEFATPDKKCRHFAAAAAPGILPWYRFAFLDVAAQSRLKPHRVMTALAAVGIPDFTGPCPEIYLERA